MTDSVLSIGPVVEAKLNKNTEGIFEFCIYSGKASWVVLVYRGARLLKLQHRITRKTDNNL